ncbi:MAG TPA: hypothetical protein EYG89_04530 [Bacteroidia bacterium]|nr:hypothetical protein [Bacteroidia bacterium]
MYKSILFAIILTTQLFSDTSVVSVTTFNDKNISIDRDRVSDIKLTISRLWDKILEGHGSSEYEIIINTKKGSIEHIVIYSKYGSIKFKKSFKKFYKSLYQVKLKPFKSKKILKFKFSSSIKIKEDEVLSTLKGTVENTYDMYLSFLRSHYNYSNKKIREILDSKDRIASKIMLEAIYFDYIKNDIDSAKLKYDLLFEHKSERFIGSPEAIFIVDYLSRENRDKDVLFLLPKNSCEFMEEKFKYRCHYYRAKSLYSLNDSNYLIPLELSKHYVKQANTLYKKIRKEKK